jgi:hypothetical protein
MATPVAPKDQPPAHALWVELSTRITSQRLHYRSGEEETAATSVYDIFKLVRGLMKENPEAKAFQEMGLELLNVTLRPYTARWHGWMTEDKELRDSNGKPVLKFRDEWVRRQFRKELRELQPRILGFQKAFGAMKDMKQPDVKWTAGVLDTQILQAFRAELGEGKSAVLGKILPLGIQEQVRFAGKVTATNINDEETKEIGEKLGAEGSCTILNSTGLAFSGGGIRSATFCLGITQVLAKRGLLGQFDYLSTVSGGGYFGSFLSAYLGTGSAETGNLKGKAEDAARIKETFEVSDNQREPRAVRHLRNRSRYMLDGDFRSQVTGVGMVLAGVLFNLLIVLPFPIIGALLTMFLKECCFFGEQIWTETWIPALDTPVSKLLIASLISLAGVLACYSPLKTRATKKQRTPKPSKAFIYWERWHNASTLAVAVLLLLWLTPAGFRLYHEVREFQPFLWLNKFLGGISMEKLLPALGTVATALLAYLASRKASQRHQGGGGKIGQLAILAGPVLYAFVYFNVGYHLMLSQAEQWPWYWVLLVVVVLLLWAWLSVDVNAYSPHSYYRDRLGDCYLQTRIPSIDPKRKTDPGPAPRLRLRELGTSTAAPYHLVNATVNLPSSEVLELRGRKGDFFVFSKHYSGGPVCGYYPTADLEKADAHLDLGTAMAISGAAASSNMGWMTSNSLRLVMTLANVRLGYWMRNPALGVVQAQALWSPGPSYLFREMFAKHMDEKQNFLNLSDGAHIENLGAYELMRRRCKFIVCVDGGQEGDMHCIDLLRLERLVSIDLGIRLHYDLTDVTLLPTGLTRAYGAMVKIDYNPPKSDKERKDRKPKEAEWGWMLYLKLATTGTEPGFVMDYKRQNPAFPHQSTGDQIYDEAQFEAYRALGECAAESMFRDELVEGEDVSTVHSWFQTLVSALLPDNDEVFRQS